jgi:hypothetical protein
VLGENYLLLLKLLVAFKRVCDCVSRVRGYMRYAKQLLHAASGPLIPTEFKMIRLCWVLLSRLRLHSCMNLSC